MIRTGLALALLFLVHDGLAQGNQAVHFDGAIGSVKVPKNPSLEPSSAITIECWAKALGSSSNGWMIRKEHGPGYDLSWSFQAQKVSALYVCIGQYTAYDTVSNQTLVGQWHHFAMTCVAGGVIRYFRDGELITEAPGPPCMDHSSDLYFGDAPFGGEEFIGYMDEVRLWNVERTPAEIKSAYKVALNSGPGLVSVWHLDGSAVDAVGDNDGSLQGSATFVPSDAPFGFTFEPHRGDWQGRTEVMLTGEFSDLSGPPLVLFGAVASPAVRLVDSHTIAAASPSAAHPGSVVDLTVVLPGGDEPGVGEYLYTPALSASPEVGPGDNLQVDLDFTPPATTAVFLGFSLAGSPTYPYSWHPECVPALRIFRAEAPFQDHVGFRMQVPADFVTGPASIVAQGLVVDDLSGKGSFTNGVTIAILSE